jgi:two-component system, chemotaxis family, CheB/CheR fusion protein
MADLSIEQLVEELSKTRGLDFRGYKRNSLERRLRKRMAELNIPTVQDYADFFHSNRSEINDLLETVLINVTTFFRDPMAWEVLRKEALPLLLDPLQLGGTFRAWCAGCASGEEVYSLAILLSEYLGPRVKLFDIKIYATDPDEQALNVARRGEYPADRLKTVPPPLREKYFQGGSIVRVNRDIRKMAIFGRGNLVGDAPISRVNLLLCRNVLIYFDLELQQQVLERFRYALEDGGILFLGKAESQLRDSANFRVINSKWRIFQCASKERGGGRLAPRESGNMEETDRSLEVLQTVQRSILGTLRHAIMVLDENDVITMINDAAVLLWQAGEVLVGKRIFETALVQRSPELGECVRRSHIIGNDLIEFNLRMKINGDERVVLVTTRAVMDPKKCRVGTLIYAEDLSHQEKLKNAVQELEATAEELHSSNEELETTNEELQSTNEELETTNEELQSTNEELETTNEELHSLNEELETANDELEMRTRELDEINRRYSETLEHMPSPIMVVSEDSKVVLWNSAAQKLFDLEAKSVVGLQVQQLPLTAALRNMLARKVITVLQQQEPITVNSKSFQTGNFKGSLEVHLAPVNSASIRAVLVIVKTRRTVRRSANGTRSQSSGNGLRKPAPPRKKSLAPKKAKPKRR